MTLSLRSSRFAYLIYAAISLLVIGVLSWATVASVRLNQRERQDAIERDYENRVRLAMYHLENWANPLLFSEFQRDYKQYAPFYYPNTEEVRFATGEILRPASIVQPSPLLMAPPRQDWILLHFQASPRGGYSSPQLIPEEVRHWPGFEDAYETWDREPFAVMLAALEYTYTVDELDSLYEHAACSLASRHATTEDDSGPASDSATPVQTVRADSDSKGGKSSDYARRALNAELVQQIQSPPEACAPQQLADANIHMPGHFEPGLFVNDDAPSVLDEVGILYQEMLPVWINLPNRPGPDLAFIRALLADGDTAIQGFIIDWPHFRRELLARITHLFPEADLEIIAPDSAHREDNALSVIPAKLVTNAAIPVATFNWDNSHSFLVVGWAVSLLLLAGLGLGIRSLISLSERRSQFAYAVTHELRTPLTTFRLYTDMLADGMVSPENQHDYLQTLNKESRRLAELVSGVLEYSRVENKSTPIAREPVTLRKILDSVRETCTSRCTDAGGNLEVEYGADADTALSTDKQFVVQILSNLIDNACKYGRNGDEATVSVTTSHSNGYCNIDVTDRGPGVPHKLRTRIFRPYIRGNADRSAVTGGIGLGLALSRAWATRLGGKLELLPTPRNESGARFRLKLPTA